MKFTGNKTDLLADYNVHVDGIGIIGWVYKSRDGDWWGYLAWNDQREWIVAGCATRKLAAEVVVRERAERSFPVERASGSARLRRRLAQAREGFLRQAGLPANAV